jgi:phage tail sheath protein FI
MTEPSFGVIFNIVDNDVYPPTYGDFSVLGIVLPSDDANATMFPLNTPVDINTGDPAVLANIGSGPLYKTLLAVNNQLMSQQVSARAVVVRVATGGDTAETMTNIIGTSGAKTGIYALLTAPSLLGVTPRLLGFPGFTGEYTFVGGTMTVTEAAARVGGNVGGGALTLASPPNLTGVQPGIYELICIGGGTSAASAPKAGGNTGGGTLGSLTSNASTTLGTWRAVCQLTATNGGTFVVLRPDGTVDGLAVVGAAYTSSLGIGFTIADGTPDFIKGDEFDLAVSAVVPTNGGVFSVADPFGNPLPQATVGSAYADQIGFTIADGSPDFQIGDEFNVTVAVTGGELLANPLCAALPAVCEALMAHAIVGGPGTTKTDAINWQTTLASKRLIPVDDPVIIENLAGTGTETQDVVAQALGIGVRVDFANAGYPFHSFANQPIQGILGTVRVDSFSLLDGATDGQELLASGVGVVARGNHADASLTDSGWSLISYMNASTDPLWNLFNKTRGRDFIHLALLKSIRLRLGVDNVTLQGVQDVLNDMAAISVDLKANDCLIGWAVGFDSSVNTPDNLRAGKFRVFFDGEEPAPILQVTIDSGLDRTALIQEIATLSTQAQQLAG